jgi:hypothetical protein
MHEHKQLVEVILERGAGEQRPLSGLEAVEHLVKQGISEH